jgi:putative inorganic carbon (hco3(-)) transporter
VALAAVGLLQLHRLWQPVIFAVDPGSERQAMTSLAGNPGDLAAFLVLPCLIAQARLAAGRQRAVWSGVLLLCGYALAATQTLTSVAALAAGSLLYWALLLPPRRALLGAAAGAMAIALLVLGVSGLRQRVVGGLESLRQGEVNAVLSGRLDGWRVAAALLAERPFAGAGHGAYRAEFARAKLALLARGERFFTGHVNASFANAHNEYLEVGADLGWPGLAALGWGLAVVAAAARRCWRRLPRSDSALLWAATAAAAVLAVAYFPFRLGPTALGWVALLAWIFAGGDEEAPA